MTQKEKARKQFRRKCPCTFCPRNETAGCSCPMFNSWVGGVLKAMRVVTGLERYEDCD